MNTLRETSKTSLGVAEPSSNSLDPSLEKAQDVALATVKGIGKLSKAVLTTPLYFTMGIARGFQNIPIAYNDTTVRRPEKVDGIQTGFEVAVSVRITFSLLVFSLIIVRMLIFVTAICIRILRRYFRCGDTAI